MTKTQTTEFDNEMVALSIGVYKSRKIGLRFYEIMIIKINKRIILIPIKRINPKFWSLFTNLLFKYLEEVIFKLHIFSIK